MYLQKPGRYSWERAVPSYILTFWHPQISKSKYSVLRYLLVCKEKPLVHPYVKQTCAQLRIQWWRTWIEWTLLSLGVARNIRWPRYDQGVTWLRHIYWQTWNYSELMLSQHLTLSITYMSLLQTASFVHFLIRQRVGRLDQISSDFTKVCASQLGP